MNNKLVSVLASVCLVLVIIIIGEWGFALHAQNELLTSTASAPAKNYQLDEMPTLDLTAQSEDSYGDWVNRPLFLKGRRPVDEPTPEQKQSIAAAATAVKFDWVLNGVYTKDNHLFAFFSRATVKVPKDNFRKRKVNEDLDGWKITDIQHDKVQLKQGNEIKELLLRKPKSKELPKAKPAPPPIADPEQQPVDEQVVDPELQPEPELDPSEENFENPDNEQF